MFLQRRFGMHSTRYPFLSLSAHTRVRNSALLGLDRYSLNSVAAQTVNNLEGFGEREGEGKRRRSEAGGGCEIEWSVQRAFITVSSGPSILRETAQCLALKCSLRKGKPGQAQAARKRA